MTTGKVCVDVPNPHAVRGIHVNYSGNGTQPFDFGIVGVVTTGVVLIVIGCTWINLRLERVKRGR